MSKLEDAVSAHEVRETLYGNLACGSSSVRNNWPFFQATTRGPFAASTAHLLGPSMRVSRDMLVIALKIARRAHGWARRLQAAAVTFCSTELFLAIW